MSKEQMSDIFASVLKSSIDGSGDRLVLSDGMNAMQDAMANGGKYVLINPAVANQLQQIGIDPYYVYESAIRLQIKLKISRIDFVKVDVDKLFEEWRGKPEKQMPVHVRLIAWLKENAGANGYVQSGNSWLLKR
jgi:hypothetical protein